MAHERHPGKDLRYGTGICQETHGWLPQFTVVPYFLCLYLGFLDCSLSIVLSSVGARALALVGVPVVSDCIVNLSSQATSAFSLLTIR